MEKNYAELSNGHKMPLVGLGTSAKNQSDLEKAIDEALKIGYRLIDTAYVYQNEVTVGKVVNRWLEEGKVKREDLFIVTKLPPIGMRPKQVGHFLKKSLKNLNLAYIDLYLIHTPVGYEYLNDEELRPMKNGKILFDLRTDLEAIWKSMEHQVDEGLTKSIGVSNFSPSQIQRIVQIARIPPANIQVELNANFQQSGLQEQCKKLGITICAYSPLGSPGRGKNKDKESLIHDPVVTDIAARYKKTPAQILLRFLVQKNIVVIPKSFNAERLKANFELFDFDLKSSDVTLLESLDKGDDGRAFTFFLEGITEHPEYNGHQ